MAPKRIALAALFLSLCAAASSCTGDVPSDAPESVSRDPASEPAESVSADLSETEPVSEPETSSPIIRNQYPEPEIPEWNAGGRPFVIMSEDWDDDDWENDGDWQQAAGWLLERILYPLAWLMERLIAAIVDYFNRVKIPDTQKEIMRRREFDFSDDFHLPEQIGEEVVELSDPPKTDLHWLWIVLGVVAVIIVGYVVYRI